VRLDHFLVVSGSGGGGIIIINVITVAVFFGATGLGGTDSSQFGRHRFVRPSRFWFEDIQKGFILELLSLSQKNSFLRFCDRLTELD
jgi:hypothetical protein